jgi:hypothetical protein
MTLSFKFDLTAFPLGIWGICPITFYCPPDANFISWLNMGIDLLFWYIVICCIDWYKNRKNLKNNID